MKLLLLRLTHRHKVFEWRRLPFHQQIQLMFLDSWPVNSYWAWEKKDRIKISVPSSIRLKFTIEIVIWNSKGNLFFIFPIIPRFMPLRDLENSRFLLLYYIISFFPATSSEEKSLNGNFMDEYTSFKKNVDVKMSSWEWTTNYSSFRIGGLCVHIKNFLTPLQAYRRTA